MYKDDFTGDLLGLRDQLIERGIRCSIELPEIWRFADVSGTRGGIWIDVGDHPFYILVEESTAAPRGGQIQHGECFIEFEPPDISEEFDEVVSVMLRSGVWIREESTRGEFRIETHEGRYTASRPMQLPSLRSLFSGKRNSWVFVPGPLA